MQQPRFLRLLHQSVIFLTKNLFCLNKFYKFDDKSKQ